MIFFKISLLFLSGSLLAFIGAGADKNPVGEARLILNKQDKMLQIVGYYHSASNTSQQLNYKLYTTKKGKSGSSRNAQGGSFEVEAGGEEMLAQTRINLNPGDAYAIKLMIFRNGELISQDSVQFEGETLPLSKP